MGLLTDGACMLGAQVWVKVTEVRDDGGGQPKINCSMRAVSQEDGRDLDPDNAAAGRRAPQFGGPVTDAPPEAGSRLWEYTSQG